MKQRAIARRVSWPDAITLTLVLICVVIELTLWLADLRVLDIPRLRQIAYVMGGFWPGLLDDWQPNYATQPYLMFVTYAFLHGGPVHLLVNMVTLVSLGAGVSARVGLWRYAVIYFLSLLGGALGFGLLASDLRPMVGASGALFGLAGAIIVWDARARISEGLTLVPVYRILALFAALNVVLWWAMEGQLAWETHLGGFLAGGLAALIFRERDAPGAP